MLTMEEARARVARGAARLDQVRPGWYDRIDDGTLTMWDPCQCIVGQLIPNTTYSSFPRHANALFPIGVGDEWPWGIDVKANDVNAAGRVWATDEELQLGFALLQDAWIEAIADRRLAGRARRARLLGTVAAPAAEAEARPLSAVTV